MVSAGGGAENEDENIEGKRSIEYFLFFSDSFYIGTRFFIAEKL